MPAGWEGAGLGAVPREAFVGVVWVGRPAGKLEPGHLDSGGKSLPWRSYLESRDTPQERAYFGGSWCTLSERILKLFPIIVIYFSFTEPAVVLKIEKQCISLLL